MSSIPRKMQVFIDLAIPGFVKHDDRTATIRKDGWELKITILEKTIAWAVRNKGHTYDWKTSEEVPAEIKTFIESIETSFSAALRVIFEEEGEFQEASEPEVEEPPKNEWIEGGYQKVMEAEYNEIEPPKKVNLLKPGRRIKKQAVEMAEGGKIRAGDKIWNKNKTSLIPHATAYFTITTMRRKRDVNPEDPDSGFERDEGLHKIIGDYPTKLKVRLACDQPDLNFITYYGKYKSSACECRGDGETAEKINGDIIECPGEECEYFKKGECKEHGILSVILEDAPRFGVVYKLRTTSKISKANLEASIAALTLFSEGHPAGMPLWLTLTPMETTYKSGADKRSKTTVYVSNLEFRGGLFGLYDYIQKRSQLRAGANPVVEMERLVTANLELGESPEEQEDVCDTFHPIREAV